MTKVDYAELAARLAPFLAGYIGPSTIIGSPIIPIPTQFGIRLVRAGTGLVEWFPATADGFFGANAASADGDAILVPPGTYTFTEELQVATNIAIVGENMQTCIIENNGNFGGIEMMKGGLLQNFTVNATRTASGGGTVVSLWGGDERTRKFINVPHIQNVTINVEIAPGTTSYAVYALVWLWTQYSYSSYPLTGGDMVTVVKDIYITMIDNRSPPAKYLSKGMLMRWAAYNGCIVADNVNVSIIGGYTWLLGIEMEPYGSEDYATLEARNCSVSVVSTASSSYADTEGFFIICCDLYDCKAYVTSFEEAIGIDVNGGYITIKDCEVYVAAPVAWGILNSWSWSLDIINCQVVAEGL